MITVKCVVSRTADQGVRTSTPHHKVTSGPAVQRVIAVILTRNPNGIARNKVRVGISKHLVIAVATVQIVVTNTADQAVIAALTIQRVITLKNVAQDCLNRVAIWVVCVKAISPQAVVSFSPKDNVIALHPKGAIGTIAQQDDVIAHSTCDLIIAVTRIHKVGTVSVQGVMILDNAMDRSRENLVITGPRKNHIATVAGVDGVIASA